ncbi:hypothetical protein BGZ82_009791 [Podila clonocystis]|nr:hypothetical protein BGZ82_009791 [Podila clonocystis]
MATQETPKDTHAAEETSRTYDGSVDVQARPATLLSLPTEILDVVLGDLCQTELVALARVNKTLCRAATPLLWRTISLKNRRQLEHLMGMEGYQGLVKNVDHIQELHLVHAVMFGLFVIQSNRPLTQSLDFFGRREMSAKPLPVKCTNLLRLVVFCVKERAEGDSYCTKHAGHDLETMSPEMEEDVISLIQQNPRLESIKLMNRTSVTTVLAIAHRATPPLHDLAFWTTISRKMAKILLDNLPPHITKFSVKGIVSRGPFFGNNAVEAHHEPIRHPSLRRLHLSGDLRGFEEKILLPFLHTCSRLTKFEVLGTGYFRNKKLREALARLGIYMTILKGTEFFLQKYHKYGEPYYDDRVDESIVAETIVTNRRLSVISLWNFPSVGPRIIAAILGSDSCLKRLDILCHGKITAADVQALLSHCRKLERFMTHMPTRYVDTLPVLYISAAGFLSMQWASLSLRAFGCVLRVPRPDYHVPTEHQDSTWSCPTIEESHAVQRQVYRHIAQQTHLRELHLGSMFSEGSSKRLWYGLEMTLESGLDELACLKGMHTVSLHHMNHRAGVKELDWMYKNWPNLRNIHGLHQKLVPSELALDIWCWKKGHPRVRITEYS